MDAILKTQAEKLAREMAPRVSPLDDRNGLMRTMMKTALERTLNRDGWSPRSPRHHGHARHRDKEERRPGGPLAEPNRRHVPVHPRRVQVDQAYAR